MASTANQKTSKRRRPVGYMLFKQYVKAVVDGLYYRKVTVIGKEHLPESGVPTVLVSNHQNCLNDPLALALLFKDRIPRFLARASVFSVHPVADRFLRYLGMLPVYRAGFEGLSALSGNDLTFAAASDALVDGQTVVLYPECGHQDKRWLGNYSVGYLKLAFLAAEKMNFSKDVRILPSCNHYSNYYHMRSDMLVKFGEPVSLEPYYDLYRQSPRKAMREVNAIVKERVSSLMLNITDLDNYEVLDFIRESEYGKEFASHEGLDPDKLQDKLEADKMLVSRLDAARETSPEEVDEVYRDISRLRSALNRLRLRDWVFKRNPGAVSLMLESAALVLAGPLFLVSMIPNALVFWLPELFKGRLLKDIMFFGSFNIGVSVFLTIPLCYIVPAIVIAFLAGITYGIAYLLACPLLLLFAWFYIRKYVRFNGKLRYFRNRKTEIIRELSELRSRIHSRLDRILAEG